MTRWLFVFLSAVAAVPCQQLQRPPINGLAHISLFAHDMEQAKSFYESFLGFAEPFSLPGNDGVADMLFFKVNDHQFIEISPEHERGSDRLSHYALQVQDTEAMRAYLANKGVAVPEKVPKGRIGNLNFMIHDPEGRAIEIVQYPADSLSSKTAGQFLPPDRISTHLRHVGFVVTKLDAEMAFYTEVLGFRETWRGSSNGQVLSWINMKVPDGDDYIELMLYKDAPASDRRGSANHLCLLVDDIAGSAQILKVKAAGSGYTKTMEPKTGVNRKRQLNLFDADGTRTELMEARTIDGTPAPSSAAPPPE